MTGENILTWDPVTSDRYTGINRFAKELSGVSSIYRRLNPTLETYGEHCETWTSSSNGHLVSFKRDDSGGKFTVAIIFHATENGIHIMDTRQNGAKKVRYCKNDVEMGNARFQAQLFDLGYLEAGDKVEIAIEFASDASESGTVSLYDYILDEEKYQEMYYKLSAQGLNVTKVRDGKLEGKITAKEDGILFTTIPYDTGWTVWVDGEKTETLAAGDTFLSVRLSAGTHEIKMSYVSPGFWYGLLGSIVCWGIFILLSIIWKRRKRISDADSQDVVENNAEK